MALDGRLLSGVGVLASVVEAGNFVRAGEALGLTQSGVSRAIARLEARVGVRLLDRSPRSVRLTEEGRLFHAQVLPLLAGVADAADSAAGAAAVARGRLRVNVDAWFARLVLAPLLPELCTRFEELSLDILVSDRLGDLVAEGVDVAVRFGEPEASNLIARKLFETRILTCASPTYLALRGEPLVPGDLIGHECLLFRDPATGRPFDWEFRRGREVVSAKVTGRIVVNDLATTIAACVAGQGIAQAFAFGLGTYIASGALKQVLADWAEEVFPLYAYHPSRHLPPKKVRAFIDFLIERLPAAASC